MISRASLHHYLHVGALLLMAIGLPTSMFLMSLSSILLLVNWFFRQPLRQSWAAFRANESATVFAAIYLLHIFGSLYTSDTTFLLNDLRIKLPLLIYPVVLGSSPRLQARTYGILLWVFTASTLFASTLVIAAFFGWSWKPITDFRSFSPFISHIRFSLLICVAVFWLIDSVPKKPSLLRLLGHALALVIALISLNFLQNVMGFIILALAFFIWAMGRSTTLNRVQRRIALSAVLIGAMALTWYTYRLIPVRDSIDVAKLPVKTANGNPYIHEPQKIFTENGHHIFLYQSVDEMERAWYNRGGAPFDSLTRTGGDVRACLMRYLTSKNLPKDSLGVWSLSEFDIQSIESGRTNYRFVEGGLAQRVRTLYREYENYQWGIFDGSSVLQRYIYAKTAWNIIHQHFWFGVGTGDLQKAFEKQYQKDQTPLKKQFQLRAHNQYLSIWAAFGIFGLLLFVVAILYPFAAEGQAKSFFSVSFLLCAMISFLAEDTLETQAGVSFFIFFYGLVLWAKPKLTPPSEN
ncbi:MAG TPA: O-antigen ligase family protein [Luteibaculaceae bacterium]|nr:O-antigen ligase family protein [Luteibaculaceae bacterium]